jgi:hypothetical protein
VVLQGQTHPCEFIYSGAQLPEGRWFHHPTQSGTHVTWTADTAGTASNNIRGSVLYRVGLGGINGWAELYFNMPLRGNVYSNSII